MGSMTTLLIAAIVFLAMLVQTVAGFGMGLVSMPLLTGLIAPIEAAALVSLVGITSEIYMLIRLRHTLRTRAVIRLIVGSLLGIPLGVAALSQLDDRVILIPLAVLMIGYSLYGLLNFKLPQLKDDRLGIGFGFAAGLLSGAYNTSGPPLVIFGTARRWTPPEFRVNLQAIFFTNSILVIITRALAGHYTGEVLTNYLIALPMMVIGAFIGFRVEKRVNPAQFRRLVLILLLLLGVRLLIA